MPGQFRISLALVFIAATTIEAAAQKKTHAKKIRLASVYLHAPLDFGMKKLKARQVAVLGEIKDGATVTVTLDPNACGLNQLGDPTICTLIAPVQVIGKLKNRRVADRRKPPRRLFEIESPRWPKSLNVYLVVPAGASGYRLVLHTPADKKRIVVPLEKRAVQPKAKPRSRR